MLDNVYSYIFIFVTVVAWINVAITSYRERKRVIKTYPIDIYIDKILQAVNNMTGSEFEDFIRYVFADIGYDVKSTPKSRDGGKDLILKTKQGKVYVEIKRYSSKNLVSAPLVLKLIGSAATDGVKKCIFLTTSGYTKDAIATAENSKIDIELIDFNGFVDLCKRCDRNRILGYLGCY